MECPICEGKLVLKKVPYKYHDIELGRYEAEVCIKCGEVFFTEESSDGIDKKAKELGIWGVEKRSKISYSGNSLIVRIPSEVSKFMKLSKGKEVIIRAEGKKRLVVYIEQ